MYEKRISEEQDGPEISDEEKLDHMSDLAEPYIDLGLDLGAKH